MGCCGNKSKKNSINAYNNNDLMDINRLLGSFVNNQKEWYNKHGKFGEFEFWTNSIYLDKYTKNYLIEKKFAYLNFYLEDTLNIYIVIYIDNDNFKTIQFNDTKFELVDFKIDKDLINSLKYNNNIKILNVS